MSTSDVEIDEQLVEAGKKLVDPPASVDELLALLDQVERCLAKVDQSPSKYMQEVLSVPLKALVGDRLFKHSNVDVRVAVASCMSEITRISAPEAPYEDDKMKEVFQLIVSSFENLYDKSARSYGKRCAILETAAKVRSCVLMLDLECDALILEMFHLFLKEIRDYHPESVFTAMETIMALVIEESEDVSPALLSSLLETVKKDNEEVQPIVKKLGERVLESCASKLKPYLSQLLKSLGVCSNDYSSVVSLICEETVEGTELNENGVHLDGGQKLDERTEEVTTPQQVDAAPDVSPESVISNGEVKEEQDSSLADSASVKKEEHGHDNNAAEKTNLSSTDEVDKSDQKSESQQEQTLERMGSNPKSSTEQIESADSEEKEADSKETAQVQDQHKEEVENDITTAASEKQSAEESLKEAVVEPSSSEAEAEADGKEPQNDGPSPHSQEEDPEKKCAVEEEMKESIVKDVKEVAEEISEKISEEKRREDEVVEKGNDGPEEKPSEADIAIDATSGSATKPFEQHSEEALSSKEVSVEMGEDEVEAPTVEGDKVSDEKPSKADNAIDATSDSEAKSLKQHKKEALIPISGGELSTRQQEDKKEEVKTSVKKDADKVTSDKKPSKADKDIDANSDSEAKSGKQRKKEAVSSSSGAGISTRKPQDKKGQPEGRKDPEKQAKVSSMKKKAVSDEKPSQAEMDIDATSESEAKSSKQPKKEASNSSTRQLEDKKGHGKGRMVSEKQVKTSAKKDLDKLIPNEKPSDADKDTDVTSDSDTKSLKQQRKKQGLSSSSGTATRKPEDKKTQDKGRMVSEKQVKTSGKKDVDKVISDEKPRKANKDIDATSDAEAKSLKQRKKEPIGSSRQAEDKKGQAKGKMVSEKQTKTSTKKDVDKVTSDEKPSLDKDATSDSEAKPLRLRKKEASSSSGGISKRQPEDKKEQVKGKIVPEKQVKTSAKKDIDKDKEVVSSSKTGNKRARDETHVDHSKKRTPAKEEKSNKKEFGKELVGTRIKVWWPLDRAYYEGKVSSFDPIKKKHKVSYVDGDVETLQLKDEKWKLITDDLESDQEQQQSEDEESLGASPERPPVKKGRTNLNSSSGKKEKVEASSKKNGAGTSSGKSKGATPTSGGKNQSSKNGLKSAKSKESEVGTSKGSSARSKQQEMPRTAKRKLEEEEDDDDLPPTLKSKTPEVAGKSNTNGSGKAKSASKSPGGTKSLPDKKRRRV